MTDQAIAEKAAEWVMLLRECSPEQRESHLLGFENWKQADTRHANAAKHVERFIDQFTKFNSHEINPARKALETHLTDKTNQTKKHLLHKALSLLIFIVLPLAVITHIYPLNYLIADYVASAGEWQKHTLPDGSKITLSGRTAIALEFSNSERIIKLYEGEIYVDVAKDIKRPLIVKTKYASIQALGTQFIVNHHDKNKTRLMMIESQAQVSLPESIANSARVVTAGEELTVNSNGLSSVSQFDIDLQKLRLNNKQLLVQDWHLDEVIDEIKRYHDGFIYFKRDELESIQVSAVLPLDDTQRALQLLDESFASIEIKQISPWLLVVESYNP